MIVEYTKWNWHLEIERKADLERKVERDYYYTFFLNKKRVLDWSKN